MEWQGHPTTLQPSTGQHGRLHGLQTTTEQNSGQEGGFPSELSQKRTGATQLELAGSSQDGGATQYVYVAAESSETDSQHQGSAQTLTYTQAGIVSEISATEGNNSVILHVAEGKGIQEEQGIVTGGQDGGSAGGNGGEDSNQVFVIIPLGMLRHVDNKGEGGVESWEGGRHQVVAGYDGAQNVALALPNTTQPPSHPVRADVGQGSSEEVAEKSSSSNQEGGAEGGANQLSSQDRACLEELERGSQLSAEEKELLEESTQQAGIQIHELDFQASSNVNSTTLMTPQELERMPEHGLEFEESVGPKESEERDQAVGIQNEGMINFNPTDNRAAVTVQPDGVIQSAGNVAGASGTPNSDVVFTSVVSSNQVNHILKVDSEGNLILPTTDVGGALLAGSSNSGISLGGVNVSMQPTSIILQNSGTSSIILNAGPSGLSVTSGNTSTPLDLSNSSETEDSSGNSKNKSAKDTYIIDNSYIGGSNLDVSKDDSPTQVYICPEQGCGKICSKKAKFKLHMLSHTGERPYKCSYEGCQWAFTTAYKLKRHEQSHDGSKLYKCELAGCGKRFTTIYNLKHHMKGHYNQNVEVCTYENCGQTFKSKYKLQMHMRKHIPPDRPFRCDFPGCGKTFVTASSFGSHHRIHEKEETEFTCSFEGCNKKFDKACRLKLHMRSHTGERPFVCGVEGCGWSFVCVSKLKRHMSKHTGDRKFMCTEEGCGKCFTRSEHLKGHMITHSGDRPYKCSFPDCDASFSARSSLYVHTKKHNEGLEPKPPTVYDCPVDGCDKTYRNKSSLNSHILKIHLPGFTQEDLQGVDLMAAAASLNTLGLETPVTASASVSSLPLASAVDTFPVTAADSFSSVTQPGAAKASDMSFEGQEQRVSDLMVTSSVEDHITPSFPTEIMSQHMGSNVVTQFVVNSSLSSPPHTFTGVTTTQEQEPIPITPTSDLDAVSIFQENRSGSARTDFRFRSKRNRQAAITLNRSLSMDSFTDIDKDGDGRDHSLSPSNSDIAPFSPGDVVITSSRSFSAGDLIMTSSAITLRDPNTGSHYVQTQLLQDDPPGDADMTFNPDNLQLPPHSSQTPIPPDLPVNILQETPSHPDSDLDESMDVDATEAFRLEPAVSSASGVNQFTESTINLQDLE
ncbi:zinc finger protein ZXDC-like isoform X2 [Branchiostoma floridae]|uniref:Zinc finger protein ZXDC-like isoform X1 n=1 Tax=Branchiostoma floridae TaxID=7739 RepID=A0A9J7L397_BRAFL|nr:zinc finger protein ZXDC-like isoform X1 [Branchiostoma floridae]XP_035675370.1 zinc finger protein ZXDC-like isoform X2 [Branchiostoma floridae]